ncbi:hypothetical protein [Pedococcus sp. 5OH_020]|uniref:hypothetical protein n=1 Tax=Pedococcus sp. 5OH_020 TaxID=2989814 RepID=UPI0022E9B0F2|nr:hypothetical protein [Pedococcus sp. 5OH_020]
MNGAADLAQGRIPLVLRLLDHQIVGAEDELLGNVDDLELAETDRGLLVVGLLSGPAALAVRHGGRSGHWLAAIWRRLHPDHHPHVLSIPMAHVTALDSAVHVSRYAQRVLEQEAGLELWLRRYVVSRLPGARGGGDDRQHNAVITSRERHEELACADDAPRLSRLLGAEVRTRSGEVLGTVIELTAEAFERRGLELGRLRLVEVVCSRRHLGQDLGYTMAPQGPALVRGILRRWHSGDRRLSLDDLVHVDWREQTLTFPDGVTARHPHERLPQER